MSLISIKNIEAELRKYQADGCRKARTVLSISAVLFAISVPLLLWADDFTSTNFISRDPINSDFGGSSNSTNFQELSAGGQVITGESTSTNFILRSGFLYFDTFTPRSQNWQWFDDETNETPVTSLAAENTAPTNIANQNIIKLRLTIADIAGVADTDIKFKIQFSEFSDFSQDVNDVVATTTCVSNSLWCYGDGVDTDNDSITTLVLTDSVAIGTHNEAATTTSTFDPAASTATEFEFTIKHAGARANATYFFRAFDVTNNKAVSLNTGETFPSLSIEGADLTFTVGGLSSGTATEGITTDITTTPTTVSFSTLSFDAEIEAAQRLTVDTNATEGYQIFVFQRQGFLHSAYGVAINPVTGTNASPTGWETGCASTASGCYGYHAGDDSLEGGSTRFAADNTYAKFSTTTAEEIAFNSGPVTNEATDIVFKTKITNQQEAGDYNSSVVYIVVPTF